MCPVRWPEEEPNFGGSAESASSRPQIVAGKAPPPRQRGIDLKALLLSVLPLSITLLLLKSHPYGALRIRDALSAAFHILYHTDAEKTWLNTNWLGVAVWKCPLDLWIYQEIIYETAPDVIIDVGTQKGGSAYFFASVFDLMKRGRVLTIDVKDLPGRPQHDRITYLLGSSTSEGILQKVQSLIRKDERVMVSLDSDHSTAHVLTELRLYSRLVTQGNYLVVEDTNLNGHPVWPKFGPGPMEALEEFLKQTPNFVPDDTRQKFGLTFNPRGYLKRVR